MGHQQRKFQDGEPILHLHHVSLKKMRPRKEKGRRGEEETEEKRRLGQTRQDICYFFLAKQNVLAHNYTFHSLQKSCSEENAINLNTVQH